MWRDSGSDSRPYADRLPSYSVSPIPIPLLINNVRISKQIIFSFNFLGDHPLKSDSDLALKDSYPLLYSSKMKISKNKDAEYNVKGFGAGGLPPLTFSHLSRNWKTSGQHTRTLEDTTTARREIGGCM